MLIRRDKSQNHGCFGVRSVLLDVSTKAGGCPAAENVMSVQDAHKLIMVYCVQPFSEQMLTDLVTRLQDHLKDPSQTSTLEQVHTALISCNAMLHANVLTTAQQFEAAKVLMTHAAQCGPVQHLR